MSRLMIKWDLLHGNDSKEMREMYIKITKVSDFDVDVNMVTVSYASIPHLMILKDLMCMKKSIS